MIALLAALPAFIQSLPYLCQLALKFITLTEKIVAWAQKNELHKWMDNLETTIDSLDKAKTVDEKRDAAKRLGDILKSLG